DGQEWPSYFPEFQTVPLPNFAHTRVEMADRFFCDRDCRRDGKSFKPLPESRFVELSKNLHQSHSDVD
ncbi:MAG TPA: hypothetical protein P5307_12720, partial [Pirellulaceae bacterium]|nr:hypothetical protein [Pirellulaceae bacterium]